MRISMLLLSMGILSGLPSLAQNVGIGTGTPTEKLDVNGNLNVNGNLKLNGNAGRAGQVLMMNNGGQQQWANMFGYKNRKEFQSSQTWIVPSGVTEIMVEVVGGGGGGAKGGGGGSGAYVVGICKVAPGESVQITVGGGGAGSPTESGSATAGGNSSFSIASTGNSITTQGGEGAASVGTGYGNPYFVFGDSLIYIRGYFGYNGSPTTEHYSQRSATEFVTERKYGDGGICMYDPTRVNKGSFFSFNTATLSNLVMTFAGNNPGSNGAGGGGGNTAFFTWGYPGSEGLVVISW